MLSTEDDGEPLLLTFSQSVTVRCTRAQQSVAEVVSRWTKPCSASFPLSNMADLARSTSQVIAENLLLWQQLLVLNRADKSALNPSDSNVTRTS